MSELSQMNIEELKAQADIFGVEYANNIGIETLRKKLAAVMGDEETTPTALEKAKPDHVTIIIARNATDKQPVFVGLNGRNYRMKRGEEVTVPRGIAEILSNAIQIIRDPDTGKDHEVEAYPFHVVR